MGRFVLQDEYEAALTEGTLERLRAGLDCRGPDECWEWQGAVNLRGYGRIQVAGKARYTHRVVWMLRHGRIPDGLSILHHCDNPPCGNESHLFIGTPGDNVRDMFDKGRQPRQDGVHNPAAKVTDEVVRGIRRRARIRESHASIARSLGISRPAVSLIVEGKRWAHVKQED